MHSVALLCGEDSGNSTKERKRLSQSRPLSPVEPDRFFLLGFTRSLPETKSNHPTHILVPYPYSTFNLINLIKTSDLAAQPPSTSRAKTRRTQRVSCAFPPSSTIRAGPKKSDLGWWGRDQRIGWSGTLAAGAPACWDDLISDTARSRRPKCRGMAWLRRGCVI